MSDKIPQMPDPVGINGLANAAFYERCSINKLTICVHFRREIGMEIPSVINKQ